MLRLAWCPQETYIFNVAAITRKSPDALVVYSAVGGMVFELDSFEETVRLNGTVISSSEGLAELNRRRRREVPSWAAISKNSANMVGIVADAFKKVRCCPCD